ncbi:acyl-CoA thioesterase [Virgibacillus ndiopensis]|uniref:acyl-CoA thioesterase n=1 Tax=Virgibacillus ndiopensis TaxID=2004408 RepID=UPI003CCC2133
MVSTNVAKIGTKSFSVKHVFTNADTGLVVAQAFATIVCFNNVEQKTKIIPEVLRDNLKSKMANHAY